MFHRTAILFLALTLLSVTLVSEAARDVTSNLRSSVELVVEDRRAQVITYNGRVVRFELINTDSDTVVVSNLTNGMIIVSSNPSFSINAFTSTTGSVRTRQVDFQYIVSTGPFDPVDYAKSEQAAPYALCGNVGRNFFKCPFLGYGTHFVTATPIATSLVPGTPYNVTFTIVPTPADPMAANRRAQDIVTFLNNITLGGKPIVGPVPSLNGTTTIADPAVRWLIHEDELQLSSDTPLDRFRLQQRYASFKLFVLPNNVVPRQLQPWLSLHECDWFTSIAGGPQMPVQTRCVDMNLGGVLGVQRVTGSIVAFERGPVALTDELGLFTKLNKFIVFDSVFQGTLPLTIGRWTDMEFFTLNGAQTSLQPFTIPTSIGNWKKLVAFYWNDRGDRRSIPFTKGTLPTEMAVWTKLSYFSLSGNAITGTVPSIISKWTNMGEFALSGQNITGTLPSSIDAWSKLQRFGLTNTAVHGSIPESYGKWRKIKTFDVHSNPTLGGTIPASLGDWGDEMNFFNVETTGISGTIPESLGNWTYLYSGAFRDTNLTGSMPASFCQLQNVDTLNADCLTEVTCSCCTLCTYIVKNKSNIGYTSGRSDLFQCACLAVARGSEKLLNNDNRSKKVKM